MRRRMIEPGFWSSAKIGQLSIEARLLFIGSWTFADDYGVLLDNNMQLFANVFPYESENQTMNIPKFIELKDELIEKGFFKQFEDGGKKLLWVYKWKQHQKIDKPSPTKYSSTKPEELFGLKFQAKGKTREHFEIDSTTIRESNENDSNLIPESNHNPHKSSKNNDLSYSRMIRESFCTQEEKEEEKEKEKEEGIDIDDSRTILERKQNWINQVLHLIEVEKISYQDWIIDKFIEHYTTDNESSMLVERFKYFPISKKLHDWVKRESEYNRAPMSFYQK